jgi:hypothetical protein
MSPRIFIGFTDIAGVGTRLEAGFRKIGCKADFYFFNKHPFDYSGGSRLQFSKKLIVSRIEKILFLIKILIKYDYFIYIGSGTGFLKNRLDIKILNFFRKKTMIMYVGCDVRMPSVVAKYKWNTCTNCPKEYQEYVGCIIPRKEKRIREEEAIFKYIFSPLECGGWINRKFFNILFPVDIDKLKIATTKPDSNRKLRIIHAPSNFEKKGTKYVLKAINNLKEEFEFEFKLIQNISIEELYAEIHNADLVIDQMLGGFYGLFAIESMALGKPVICYLRDDAIEYDNPIINANPDTIYEVLKSIIRNPSGLYEIGLDSRKYVEQYHSYIAVCNMILSYLKSDK